MTSRSEDGWPVEPSGTRYRRVPVEAFHFTGDNWPTLSAWVGGAQYLGDPPQRTDWVMRVLGGVRAVPCDLFAVTYESADDRDAS